MGLHVFSSAAYEKVVFGMPSVCVCMYVYTYIPPEELDGFYSYSVFKIVFVIGLCPVNMNILVPKLGSLRIGSVLSKPTLPVRPILFDSVCSAS
jgi:hypothetical protein